MTRPVHAALKGTRPPPHFIAGRITGAQNRRPVLAFRVVRAFWGQYDPFRAERR